MASYQELLDAFMRSAPPEVLALQGTDAFGDAFNDWAGQIAADLGVESFEDIPVEEIGNYEYVPAGGATTTGPAEQEIFNRVAPTLAGQIDADVGRTADVDRMTQQTGAAFGDLSKLLGQAAMTFDGVAYFQQNPDVALAYQNLPDGPNGGKIFNDREMNQNEFAAYHYETSGKNEGRTPTYTSDILKSNLANIAQTTAAQSAAASTAAKTQLDELQKSIATMQGNLQGALGQQAAALQDAVTALNKNLETLDASQRDALAKEIAARQANLEQSITAQRAALQQQVAELAGNASGAAQAKRAALEQQIAELTAAQAPVAEARIKGAEALTTAINLGLEGTRDQLAAEAAREGFVGPSTMTDAALARAAIGARQEAANVGAQARLANALDTRGIGNLGAQGRYSISDALAGQQQAIADYGATGRAGLSSNLATGTREIGDYGAGGARTIADTTAGNRANVGSFGAMGTLENKNRGISANLDLLNTGATGTYDINTALAQQQKDIADRTAAAEAEYRDKLFSTALSAGGAATALPGQEAAAKTALLPYSTAGTKNALDLLSWWNAPAAVPTTTAAMTQPSTSGTNIANLGSSILGAGMQWWKPTATSTTTKSTVPTSLAKTGTSWADDFWKNMPTYATGGG